MENRAPVWTRAWANSGVTSTVRWWRRGFGVAVQGLAPHIEPVTFSAEENGQPVHVTLTAAWTATLLTTSRRTVVAETPFHGRAVGGVKGGGSTGVVHDPPPGHGMHLRRERLRCDRPGGNCRRRHQHDRD
jgi:hypothetical protein